MRDPRLREFSVWPRAHCTRAGARPPRQRPRGNRINCDTIIDRSLATLAIMESNTQQPQLDRLERDIKGLQIDFTRFFAGDLERPPSAQQDELASRVQRLRADSRTTTVDRFRLNSLAARLGSLNELFDRRMRQHAARRQNHVKLTDAVVAGSERGARAVRQLFHELYKDDSKPASVAGFREFLEKKVNEIRDRTGCTSVQFRVIENDGRRSLRARALGRAAQAKSK